MDGKHTAAILAYLDGCYDTVERGVVKEVTRGSATGVRRVGRIKTSLSATAASSLTRSMQKSVSGGGVVREKKVRRQIANSNERKRMESINHGFQCLRVLLPLTDSSEKLSKAAILQQASSYINTLLVERKRLLAINAQCMLLIGGGRTLPTPLTPPPSSLPPITSLSVSSSLQVSSSQVASQQQPSAKRRKSSTESSDEGIGLVPCDCSADSSGKITTQRVVASDYSQTQHKDRTTEEDLRRKSAIFRPPQLLCPVAPPPVSSSSSSNRESLSACRADPDPVNLSRKTTHLSAVSQYGNLTMPAPSKSDPPNDLHKIWEGLNLGLQINTGSSATTFSHPCASSPPFPVTTALSSSPPVAVSSDCSVSRRNLATIVMAIRHLEGDFISDRVGSPGVASVTTTSLTPDDGDCCTVVEDEPDDFYEDDKMLQQQRCSC